MYNNNNKDIYYISNKYIHIYIKCNINKICKWITHSEQSYDLPWGPYNNERIK